MSLEQKSNELKELVSTYDTQWLLGDLSGLMKSGYFGVMMPVISVKPCHLKDRTII